MIWVWVIMVFIPAVVSIGLGVWVCYAENRRETDIHIEALHRRRRWRERNGL